MSQLYQNVWLYGRLCGVLANNWLNCGHYFRLDEPTALCWLDLHYPPSSCRLSVYQRLPRVCANDVILPQNGTVFVLQVGRGVNYRDLNIDVWISLSLFSSLWISLFCCHLLLLQCTWIILYPCCNVHEYHYQCCNVTIFVAIFMDIAILVPILLSL